jgi:hypothetical protein
MDSIGKEFIKSPFLDFLTTGSFSATGKKRWEEG